MRQLSFTILIMVSCGSMLLLFERYGGTHDPVASKTTWFPIFESSKSQHSEKIQPLSSFVRAPGKIEGKSESIELQFRIAEQIQSVLVTEGMQVAAGDVLVSLDSERFAQERDLAKSLLDMALAKKLRLENGARKSEIEAATQEYEANLSPLWSAERALDRGQKLFDGNAISQQKVDELTASVDAIRAKAAAAKARLATLKLPARLDEMAAANADVRAAESRLQIALINLKRTELRAPIDGRILKVNAKIGELAGPESLEPMIVMADTSQFHAIAEVDEFDAMKVQLGQRCEITSDANSGVLATGAIVEIEPQMTRKKMYGQWAGERVDTFSRRVKIALEDANDLPIGLPIEVAIQAD